jgi:hypothetical protein
MALFGRNKFANFPPLAIQFQILCARASWCTRGQKVADDADRYAWALLRDHFYPRADNGLDVGSELRDAVFK